MSELRIETFVMPAADLGDENPLPPLRIAKDPHTVAADPSIPREIVQNMAYGHLPNILPYAIQDDYTRNLQPREFRVAVLENETLKATFLLEFGGRLWSLYHKPARRELLYVNPVFQPANLALRNAWFSGGVEWNIGTIGHSPFTCAPLFAARLETPDGTPVLRMYEWERIRQVPFQLDAYLPDGSPVLFLRVRITNPHHRKVPMYWWSNIAVPETPATRVIVPAQTAYRFAYQKHGLELIPTPLHNGENYTYPTRIKHSADYFFNIPANSRPWIAALDETGRGLIQVSTPRLKGRKLFLWGTGTGGRKWQEFLSKPGEAYIEIQAGLARTQMEHVPMPAQADWSWLEAYGLMEADPDAIHGDDWLAAVQSVENALERLVPQAQLDAEYRAGASFEDEYPIEILQHGSGWGALENIRRKHEGKPPISSTGLVFSEDTLGVAQIPWFELLQTGVLLPPKGGCSQIGFMVQTEWQEILEQAVQAPKADWCSWYHLGIMRAYANDRTGARLAWEKSLKLAVTPWTLRNLALLVLEDGDMEEAVSFYIKAVRMKPELLPLAVECGHALLQSEQPQKWLDLITELPMGVRSAGRIQLLEAQAALAVGDFERVEQFFADDVTIPDLREGELSLSDFWLEYQTKRLSIQEGIPVNRELKARVSREFPVPAHLDFRMNVEE